MLHKLQYVKELVLDEAAVLPASFLLPPPSWNIVKRYEGRDRREATSQNNTKIAAKRCTILFQCRYYLDNNNNDEDEDDDDDDDDDED